MEDVRFRGQVRPGDRLVLVSKASRVHRRQTIFETQGFVGTNMVYHGRIIGVPLPKREEARPAEPTASSSPTADRCPNPVPIRRLSPTPST